jgi:3-deoxy-manno-octulosonate cytidylyltransferase (CMP-KDO synthetase)
VIATDDERIVAAARAFHARVEMTSSHHPSGTDRVAEVAARLSADIVINVQGDEPQIDPAAIDRLAELMRDPAADMATLAVPISDLAAYLSPNVVKVVCDDRGRALYFSRSPIPMVRDGMPDFAAKPARFFQHLGVYAYRRPFLLNIAATPPHPLERAEQLEQLRVLGMGATIGVASIAHAHRGIDTPADYAAFVKWYRASSDDGANSPRRAA